MHRERMLMTILTGKALLNELVYELNELKFPNMAARLDSLYHTPGFLEMDRMTLLAELLREEYAEKLNKTLHNRLRTAKLIGSHEELDKCIDSAQREYMPLGISQLLSSLDFIAKGYNICILGAFDAGKSYLARAIGIRACNNYSVRYFHSAELIESMAALKQQDYGKFSGKMRQLIRTDLIILDDFLLHTITDEKEVKILFELLERRNEQNRSMIVCSQRDPDHWTAMILNDEVSANSILKRATRHYRIMIKGKKTSNYMRPLKNASVAARERRMQTSEILQNSS